MYLCLGLQEVLYLPAIGRRHVCCCIDSFGKLMLQVLQTVCSKLWGSVLTLEFKGKEKEWMTWQFGTAIVSDTSADDICRSLAACFDMCDGLSLSIKSVRHHDMCARSQSADCNT